MPSKRLEIPEKIYRRAIKIMFVRCSETSGQMTNGIPWATRVKFLHSRAAGPEPYTNERAAREINAVGGRQLFRPACEGKPAVWWRPVIGEEEYKG
jgi:hypothetical protein